MQNVFFIGACASWSAVLPDWSTAGSLLDRAVSLRTGDYFWVFLIVFFFRTVFHTVWIEFTDFFNLDGFPYCLNLMVLYLGDLFDRFKIYLVSRVKMIQKWSWRFFVLPVSLTYVMLLKRWNSSMWFKSSTVFCFLSIRPILSVTSLTKGSKTDGMFSASPTDVFVCFRFCCLSMAFLMVLFTYPLLFKVFVTVSSSGFLFLLLLDGKICI